MSSLDGLAVAPPAVTLRRLAQYAQLHWGVMAQERRLSTLAYRLNRRIRALGLKDVEAYLDFLFRRGGLAQEQGAIIDAITTRTTSFFRELDHFEFLRNTVLSEVTPRAREEGRSVRLWSAACSSGQEAYSMAITCEEAFARYGAFSYEVRATDISPDAIAKTRAATYRAEDVDGVPSEFLTRYFLQSRAGPRRVRLAKSIRDRIRTGACNLKKDYDFGQERYDVIFIRNCLIYFDHETKLQVGRRLANRLHPGGYLITGHVEHYAAGDLPLTTIRPTIHRKPLIKGDA